MKKNLNIIGITGLIIIFLLFYLITDFLLGRDNNNKQEIDNSNNQNEVINNNYNDEKRIITNLYSDIKILYDVVNNKFKVSQEETITIGDIVYKKITNFNDVMDNLFTSNGIDKYITDMGSYFAKLDDVYYLAGNLVSYQTYYFRGDETNIYIIDSTSEEINAIIYERWTSNNRNTLATIKVVNVDNKWLIDEINILSSL